MQKFLSSEERVDVTFEHGHPILPAAFMVQNWNTAVRKYSAAAHNLLEKSYKGGNAPKEL